MQNGTVLKYQGDFVKNSKPDVSWFTHQDPYRIRKHCSIELNGESLRKKTSKLSVI
jgi:hypothetical protein